MRRHSLALILFPLLSLIWVGDALFLGVDLSAFDVIFRLPHWKAEHEYRGVQKMILSDSPQAHYPERALKWRAVRQGDRVDFNPYIFTGMREISQGTGGFITSPFQLVMDVSEAIDWSTWLRLALAGLFMYGFLVTLRVETLPAVLGGILWAFNLHQIAWLEFPQHLATQLWIPALFCFNCLILRRGFSWQSLMGILVTNALFFTSGYTQIVLFTYVALGVFNTVYLASDSRLAVRERVRRWLTVHLVFVVSALVLAPRLAAELQVLTEGLRAKQEWRMDIPGIDWSAATFLATAKNLLPDIGDYKRLFSPNFFGGLWGDRYVGQSFYKNIVLGSLYTGILVFLLVPASLCWLRTRSRRPLILASGGALLFSFGMIHEDPTLVNVFQQIPHSGYGGYDRYVTIVVFLLAGLSAAGLQVLMNVRRRAGRYLFFGILVITAASPLIVRVADPGMPLQRMVYPVALLAVVGLAAAALCLARRWRGLPVLLIAVAVIDLFIVTYDFNPRMENERNFAVTTTLRHLIDDPSAYRVAEISRRQLYPPNILQYYGIPSIEGYSTVAPARYLELISEVIDDYHVTANGQMFLFDVNLDVFRLLNVKYVLSRERLDDERVRLIREARGYQMYELKDPLPRAYCATTLLRFESEKKLLKSFRDIASRYDRPLALVGEKRSPVALTPGCNVRDIEAYLSGVAFTVWSDAPSYVVVPYSYYSSWKAWSGDEALSVLNGNYNFVALPVEAGEQRIRLIYQDPLHVLYGAVMLGLGVLVVGWFVASRERSIAACLLAYAGVILVLFSLLELPGIANPDVPERSAPSVVLPAGSP